MSGILDKVISGYIKAGPTAKRISRIKPEDNDPIFLDIAQDEEGYIYLLARKEAAKKELLRLKEKDTELSLNDAVKALIEERLSYWGEDSKAAHKIPTTAPPFDSNGNALIGNNPPCHVLFESVAKGGKNARNKKNGWRGSRIDPEQPVFSSPQRAKGEWTVAFDNDNTGLIGNWERVEGLSALHTKLGLFIFAKICDPRNQMRHPSKEPVGVSYEDLRRALGLREMSLEKFKPLVDGLVRDWADLKATVRNVVIGGLPIGIAECALFVISKVWDKQFELHGEPVQIGWLFDPGPWAKHYFNRDAKPWLSTLQTTVLELDHRDIMRSDVLALHIATLLFVVAGGDQFKKQAIQRTVEELLEMAGELPEPEHRGGHWAARTRERLEIAFETMLAAKLAAAIEYEPNFPDPIGKGWVERWLSATITLTSPEAAAFLMRNVPEPKTKLPARPARKQRALKPPKPQPCEKLDEQTAERLRVAITRNFENQTNAAKYFGCTQSKLSRALARIFAPDRTLAAKFKTFLDSLTTDGVLKK